MTLNLAAAFEPTGGKGLYHRAVEHTRDKNFSRAVHERIPAVVPIPMRIRILHPSRQDQAQNMRASQAIPTHRSPSAGASPTVLRQPAALSRHSAGDLANVPRFSFRSVYRKPPFILRGKATHTQQEHESWIEKHDGRRLGWRLTLAAALCVELSEPCPM